VNHLLKIIIINLKKNLINIKIPDDVGFLYDHLDGKRYANASLSSCKITNIKELRKYVFMGETGTSIRICWFNNLGTFISGYLFSASSIPPFTLISPIASSYAWISFYNTRESLSIELN